MSQYLTLIQSPTMQRAHVERTAKFPRLQQKTVMPDDMVYRSSVCPSAGGFQLVNLHSRVSQLTENRSTLLLELQDC